MLVVRAAIVIAVKRNRPGKGRMSRAGEKGSQPGHHPGFGPNHACGESPNSSGARMATGRGRSVIPVLERGPGCVTTNAPRIVKVTAG